MSRAMHRASDGGMRRTRRTAWAGLVALVLATSAEALAQTKESGAKPIPQVITDAQIPQAKTDGKQQTQRLIVVSIADRKLALVENGKVVKLYGVAVGAKVSPSPPGEYTIVHRIPKPTYYAPGVIMPSGKNNPLGTRWIGLSIKGFGIHGTNQPRSIGRSLSHGCIRMRNRDVEDLFERVRVGDRVQLAAERSEEIAQIFAGAPAMLTEATAQTAKTEASAEGDEIEKGRPNPVGSHW
ncbi:MAG TPA: L,D-transpeptidase [Candidatus Dormibacteraeota bacterium]|nr:L,D-transpeptidase [Candidatus Dormibacteraeota bacterium]